MKLSANEEAAAQVRSIAYLKLDELKDWLSQQAKSMADEDQKAHYLYAASQITLFQESPNKVKLTAPLNPPKGPPI